MGKGGTFDRQRNGREVFDRQGFVFRTGVGSESVDGLGGFLTAFGHRHATQLDQRFNLIDWRAGTQAGNPAIDDVRTKVIDALDRRDAQGWR